MVHIDGFYSTYKRRRVNMFDRKDKLVDAREKTNSLTLEKRQTRWRSRKDKLACARKRQTRWRSEETNSLTLERDNSLTLE